MTYKSSETPLSANPNRPSQAGFLPTRPQWEGNTASQEAGNIPPTGIASGWGRASAPSVPFTPPTQTPSFPPQVPTTPSSIESTPTTSFVPPSPRQRQTKKQFLIVGSAMGIVLLLSTIFVLWLLAKTGNNVTLYAVNQKNVTQYVGGGGIIYPQQQFDLSYSLPERVTSLLVKAGDKVTTNQPLIQLDPGQLNAQITQAANDMAAAQAYLTSVSANGNAVAIAQAQQAYDQAKNRYNALVAEYSSPLVHNGALISPMDGIVTSVNVNSGEVFTADTPLLTIMDESKIIVHVQIPLTYLGTVHIGQAAVITPSASPNSSYNGTVSSIIPQADPQTDTFEVWITVPNPDDSLLPGMSAFVRIQQNLTAIAVPRLAVLNPDREASVFVVRQQHAFLQHVSVVGRSIHELFISSGLSKGDLVVLVGADGLQDGQTVRVQKVETASPQAH